MILFSEDKLLESAASRLLREYRPDLQIHQTMGNKGYRYFEESLPSIIRSSQQLKFLVFLDGDLLGKKCPQEQINEWRRGGLEDNLKIRFACKEVENWILGDREGVARLLSIAQAKIPAVDDATDNAKELLVRLASQSRNRGIREDLVPQAGHSSVIGPAYNLVLSEFLRSDWNCEVARGQSNSLDRACRAIQNLFLESA